MTWHCPDVFNTQLVVLKPPMAPIELKVTVPVGVMGVIVPPGEAFTFQSISGEYSGLMHWGSNCGQTKLRAPTAKFPVALKTIVFDVHPVQYGAKKS